MLSPTPARSSISRTWMSLRPESADRLPMTLRELYTQQLSERGFRPDPVQAAVVDRLDDLRERLIAARESDGSIVRRWFGALGNKSAAEPIRGIYLWGGVGRGKTWM